MDTFNIEFHFPYDKVKIEKLPRSEADYYASCMHRGNLFEVKLLDYKGEPTGGIELVNPNMVTHVRITKYKPF